MVISNIKLGFAKKKIAALLRKKDFSEGADSVEGIGILLDEADPDVVNRFYRLKKDLGVKDEDFKIMLCLSSKPKKSDFDGLIFTPADVNWRGEFKTPEISDFVTRKFKILISYTKKQSKAVNIIATASNAVLKVNRIKEEPSEFDLTIITAYDNAEVFVEELKKYLKILN